MSLPSRKSPESLTREIQYCQEMARNHFALELNLLKLDSQLQSLIIQKIEDYFHQRFKDWLVVDLLALRSALEPMVKEQRKADGMTERHLKRVKPTS
jgi:hypothetical protein